jgi:hypothetical protein
MLFKRILFQYHFKKIKNPFLITILFLFHTHVQGHEKPCLNNFFRENCHNLREREGELQNVHKVFLGKNGFKSTNYEEKKSKVTTFGCCLVIEVARAKGDVPKILLSYLTSNHIWLISVVDAH